MKVNAIVHKFADDFPLELRYSQQDYRVSYQA